MVNKESIARLQTLAHFTPEMEIYSIDEAFLGLANFSRIDF